MIGDNIKRLMKENGYTQKQLAIRSGCTESAISKYANNEREPSIKALKNLAIALGVTVDELLGNATLDVVPREEVDRLRHILNSYAIQYGSVKDQQEVIDRIKAETAMDIFAEIDILGTYNPTLYAELKKKYTEENT